jgi:pilus assembly protein CpaC
MAAPRDSSVTDDDAHDHGHPLARTYVRGEGIMRGQSRMRGRMALVALVILSILPGQSVLAQSEVGRTTVLPVPVGNSVVVTHDATLERILITDPEIADAVPVTAREVVVNGLRAGTTTLLFWDNRGQRHSFSVRVTPDAESIRSELNRMFPGTGIEVTAVGNSVILTGETADPRAAERAISLATSLANGSEVINYISTPDPGQVMLRVRVAEVSRTLIERLGINLMRFDPNNLRGGDEGLIQSGGVSAPTGSFPASGPNQTFSDAVNFYLFHHSSNVAAFIQALQDEGVFRSLAEPNLITVPGETASFLAGGEFPFPMVQPQTGTVTAQFREFGIRLNFTPTITNSGAIRLWVEPEVSALDFASGVQIAGTLVPALLSRRAETTIELADGQTFAIAGLMDSEITETVNKVPLLGDIPILGAFFRSTEARENKTELLVLVTPHFVRPSDEMPEIPTGELETWPWSDFMQRPLRMVPPPANGTGEGSDEGG